VAVSGSSTQTSPPAFALPELAVAPAETTAAVIPAHSAKTTIVLLANLFTLIASFGLSFAYENNTAAALGPGARQYYSPRGIVQGQPTGYRSRLELPSKRLFVVR
jgi:hypothetical protein